MKKIILCAMAACSLLACQQQTTSEGSAESAENTTSPFTNGINWWNSKNATANYLSSTGVDHLMNIEFVNAYVLFEEAVEIDSSMFACHVALSMLSREGEKKEFHKQMAKKYAQGQNEASNLFVSLLDVPNDSTGREKRAAIWAEMHELSNGPFIHMRYAMSRSDTTMILEELKKLQAILNENNIPGAYVYNMMGYVQYMLGDLDAGTKDIEKYMELNPEGYNPIDSRAEFYLFEGDTSTAIDYYKKVLEKFPFSISAINQLRALEESDD